MTGLEDARELAGRLAGRIGDERVLEAIASTPREPFVPAPLRDRAYDNEALPIAGGQTISQPLVVARMLELLALTGDELVLDVGTGSGYHAALLALLAREVISIEVVRELHDAALDHARPSWGSAMSPACSPTAGPGSRSAHPTTRSTSPPPRAASHRPDCWSNSPPGGRMVAPIGRRHQYLTVYRRALDGRLRSTTLEPVRFVPLVRPRPPA